ncbi:MAG: S58 family peptidase, partial [Verrucomicrobiae bacterium]|nr:S58 family peptidase [Verrucomicrobiae bacterium]
MRLLKPSICFLVFWGVALVLNVSLTAKPRARDLGIPFEGKPGPLNAITDVQGIEVGYASVVKGRGKLYVGQGPARTGV